MLKKKTDTESQYVAWADLELQGSINLAPFSGTVVHRYRLRNINF